MASVHDRLYDLASMTAKTKREALAAVTSLLRVAKAPSFDVEWRTCRQFAAALDSLPAEVITPFVAAYIGKQKPLVMALYLRRVTVETEAAVLAGLAACRAPAAVFLRSLAASGGSRTATSPVGALFAARGWGTATPIVVSVDSTTFLGGLLRAASIRIELDAEGATWSSVAVGRVLEPRGGGIVSRLTVIHNLVVVSDQHELGPLGVLDDIPAYLARAAVKLRLQWDWPHATIATKLRGKARAAVVEWLSKSSPS